MGQFSKVLLTSDNVHKVPQRALDCGPGLGLLDSAQACRGAVKGPMK